MELSIFNFVVVHNKIPRGLTETHEADFRLYSHLSLTREWPSTVARGRVIPLKFEQYSGLTQ